MPRCLAVAAILLVVGTEVAEAVGLNDPVLQVGVGTLSCASWLNGPMARSKGDQWILGFWTAMNVFSTPGGVVGASTDQTGIVGEVQKDCQEQPSQKLMYATYKAYARMEKAGR